MVPKWHQASAGASGQMLEAAQVGGLLGSELWLYPIAGHLLYMESRKMLAKEAAGMVVYYLEGSCTIIHPPAGVDGVGGPQLVAVTLTRGRTLPVQSLELSVLTVQGCRYTGSWLGCSMN